MNEVAETFKETGGPTDFSAAMTQHAPSNLRSILLTFQKLDRNFFNFCKLVGLKSCCRSLDPRGVVAP